MTQDTAYMVDERQPEMEPMLPLSPDERAAILEAVRDFAQSELAPHALEWDEQKHFPREALRMAGELGLGGIYVREDVGGSALSRSDTVAIVEELAKADPSIAAYITIHNMVAWMIDSYGTDEQRHAWLPRLTAMTDFGSYCLTEPGAGSDAAAITTSAIRDGDDYVLTGVKQFISGGGRGIRLRRHGPHRRARRARDHRVPRPGRHRGPVVRRRTRRRWAGTPSRRAR